MSSRHLQNYLLSGFPFFTDEEEQLVATSSSSDLSVYEDEKAVYVEAPLAGLAPSEIDVIFQKGILLVRGSKKEEEEEKNRKYYTKASRSYVYQVAIPGTIDEKVEPKAEFKNGVMKTTFMKQKKEEPRRIPVQSL